MKLEINPDLISASNCFGINSSLFDIFCLKFFQNQSLTYLTLDSVIMSMIFGTFIEIFTFLDCFLKLAQRFDYTQLKIPQIRHNFVYFVNIAIKHIKICFVFFYLLKRKNSTFYLGITPCCCINQIMVYFREILSCKLSQ